MIDFTEYGRPMKHFGLGKTIWADKDSGHFIQFYQHHFGKFHAFKEDYKNERKDLAIVCP